MPSPIRLISRCTRKKPTVGASTPTIAPAANASRMNSRSSMDVATGRARGLGARRAGRRRRSARARARAAARRARPRRTRARRTGSSRRARCAAPRAARRALPAPRRRRRSSARRAPAARLGRERLRDEGPLLLAARRAAQRPRRDVGEPDALERLVDGGTVLARRDARARRNGARPASTTSRTVTGACDAELRALCEVPDPGSVAERRAGSPNRSTSPRVGRSSPSASRNSVVLPPPLGPAIATNSPRSTRRSTPREHGPAPQVGEVDVVELDR